MPLNTSILVLLTIFMDKKLIADFMTKQDKYLSI
jgi:hypothetical protein